MRVPTRRVEFGRGRREVDGIRVSWKLHRNELNNLASQDEGIKRVSSNVSPGKPPKIRGDEVASEARPARPASSRERPGHFRHTRAALGRSPSSGNNLQTDITGRIKRNFSRANSTARKRARFFSHVLLNREIPPADLRDVFHVRLVHHRSPAPFLHRFLRFFR